MPCEHSRWRGVGDEAQLLVSQYVSAALMQAQPEEARDEAELTTETLMSLAGSRGSADTAPQQESLLFRVPQACQGCRGATVQFRAACGDQRGVGDVRKCKKARSRSKERGNPDRVGRALLRRRGEVALWWKGDSLLAEEAVGVAPPPKLLGEQDSREGLPPNSPLPPPRAPRSANFL